MRHFTGLAILTCLALSASSGAALAQASGFVSASTGTLATDHPYDGEISAWAVEVAASGVYNFTPQFGVQGDLVLSSYIANEDLADVSNFDGAIHAFFRNSDSFLVGGFVQLGNTEVDYGEEFSIDVSRRYIGAEGQLYFDALTIYGQLGWQEYEAEFYRLDGGFAIIEARYFVTDDFRVDAHAGVSKMSLDGDNVVTFNLGIGSEYKFAELPLSVFGKLDYYTTDSTFSEFSSVRAMVGLKFNFGDDTLFHRDRSGPTLRPVEVPVDFFSGSPS